MTNHSFLRLRRLFGVLLSLSIVVAGLCLMAGSVLIYTSGEPYSRQAVRDTFARFALPVYICLALTLLGFVWEIFFPTVHQTPKPPKAYRLIRRHLLAKRNPAACDPAIGQAIKTEQTRRKRQAIIRLILVCAGIGVFLLYALQNTHFHPTDINGSVIRAMWVAIPCFGIPAGFAVFAAWAGDCSLRREIDLLRSLPAADGTTPQTEAPAKGNSAALTAVRWGLLALAVGALLYGWLAGGTVDVLAKAINICTECIGLG